jgi:hypothetical protein
MIINAWVEIRDDFAFPADDPADDTELQAKNRETLARCGDIAVIPNLYNFRVQGPRSWELYSLLYDVATRQEFEQAVELFKSENPGQTDVLGAWHFEDGRQVGIELDGSGVPLYPIPGKLADFMPDEPDGTPNPTRRDVNIYAGQALRDFS